MNVDVETFKGTLDKWNTACADGNDVDFGRPAAKLGALDEPPYYAIQCVPVMVNTQGGPKRTQRAEIVDPFNKPIGRLYSAGELGAIYAMDYNGGGNIGTCFAFGRIAGEQAAGLTSWD
jgi:succinate dehydrogenase/fumarate reductase flavoprotein subunit